MRPSEHFVSPESPTVGRGETEAKEGGTCPGLHRAWYTARLWPHPSEGWPRLGGVCPACSRVAWMVFTFRDDVLDPAGQPQGARGWPFQDPHLRL